MISSPLRYPGGKAKLYPFFLDLIKENSLYGSCYCEPYAGGAGLALKLLTNGFVSRIVINDLDVSIYEFWTSVFQRTDELCALIDAHSISIDEWMRQREIWRKQDFSRPLELGFSAYFLNRTNRSGIIEGAGPIGGYAQEGKWKIDARFNKERQIKNIKFLSEFADRVEVTNRDALEFVDYAFSIDNSLVYLDPPYYVKGRKLYANFYEHDDHEKIARRVEQSRGANWIVSYDDVPEIRSIYNNFSPISYSLNYSAGAKGKGKEVIFTSDALSVPKFDGFETAA